MTTPSVAPLGVQSVVALRYLRVLLCSLLFVGTANGHRLSPAYFGLTEVSPNSFAAEWKVSIPGGLADVLEPQIPAGCTIVGSVRRFTVDDARLMHAQIECVDGLAEKLFRVEGLSATDTDVLLRVGFLDGTSFTHRLIPSADSVEIPAQAGAFDVMRTYFFLGGEHILLGVDHLLFVLALLLLVKGVGRLVATITAFTIAHSITLAAASLGFVHIPAAPVEAVIALSIVFLATELARRRIVGDRDNLTARFPWIVAFVFGLLHGFGFAGALVEIGLPENAIPLALLFFNIGVEIGQLLFIGGILVVVSSWRRLRWPAPVWLPQLSAYAIGSVAAMWLFERSISLI